MLKIHISKRRIAEPIVLQVIADLADQMRVSVCDHGDELVAELFPLNHKSPADAGRRFREALTGALLEDWCRGEAIPAFAEIQPSPLALGLTLRLADEVDFIRLVIGIDHSGNNLPALLSAVAPLRKRARIVLESTAPVDRIILVLRFRKEERMPEVIGDLLTRLM